MDKIDLKDIFSKKYNLAKVFIDSDNSNTFDVNVFKIPTISATFLTTSKAFVALLFPAHLAITFPTAISDSTQANNLDKLDK